VIVNIFGKADHRSVIYTLLKFMQKNGDVLFVSSDPRYKRLLPPYKSVDHLENILVSVTDDNLTAVLEQLHYDKQDFEEILYDGTPIDDADLYIYVQGTADDEEEAKLVEMLNPVIITIGKLGCKVPFSRKQLINCEKFEACKHPIEIDEVLTKEVANKIAPKYNIPAKTFMRVVKKA